MSEVWRPLLIICIALLVPVLPFLGFGGWLEAQVTAWLESPPAPVMIALGTVAILSTDILLPVPSSVVSTVAGAQLGVLAATAASWLGMTLGATLGFALARFCGRPLAERYSSVDDLQRMDWLATRYGPWILVGTRALPVLAEAAVLFLGATRLSWRQFLPAVMISNLGIAAVYSVLGHYARSQGELPLALAASIALPVLAATMARWLLPSRSEESNTPSALPPA